MPKVQGQYGRNSSTSEPFRKPELPSTSSCRVICNASRLSPEDDNAMAKNGWLSVNQPFPFYVYLVHDRSQSIRENVSSG